MRRREYYVCEMSGKSAWRSRHVLEGERDGEEFPEEAMRVGPRGRPWVCFPVPSCNTGDAIKM